MQEYVDFLMELEYELRECKKKNIIIGGDFNANRTNWGSPYSDRKRNKLLKLLYKYDQYICNTGTISTAPHS